MSREKVSEDERETKLSKDTDQSAEKNKLAKLRTDLAFDRTLLANERTFSAWVRTGITGVAAGLGIAKLLGTNSWMLSTQIIGAIFIIFGSGTFVVAWLRYIRSYHRLVDHRMPISRFVIFTILMLALMLATVIAFVLIWS